MNFNPDDPKWTAYILGELDASERAAEKAAIEEMLASSEEARAYLDELRMAADALEFELKASSKAKARRDWRRRSTRVSNPH
jgi:anti-sigma factor RsiW